MNSLKLRIGYEQKRKSQDILYSARCTDGYCRNNVVYGDTWDVLDAYICDCDDKCVYWGVSFY